MANGEWRVGKGEEGMGKGESWGGRGVEGRGPAGYVHGRPAMGSRK